jgi:hypothetical protein
MVEKRHETYPIKINEICYLNGKGVYKIKFSYDGENIPPTVKDFYKEGKFKLFKEINEIKKSDRYYLKLGVWDHKNEKGNVFSSIRFLEGILENNQKIGKFVKDIFE